MKIRAIVFLLLSSLLAQAAAPTTGQFLFQRRPASGGFTQFGVTPETGKAFGWDGTNVVMLATGGSPAWGSITGTLSNQTDLQNALNAKVTAAGTLALGGFSSITGTLPNANLSATVQLTTGTLTLSGFSSIVGVLDAANLPANTQYTDGVLALDSFSSVTGTIPIANGGTGQNNQTSAFDALAPTTTEGDIIFHNGTDNVRLAKGTANQVLRINAGATAPEWATPTTYVSSVAFSPTPLSVFSVTGSPITSSGTIGLALASQSANRVLASATSGGSAVPAFRSLVAADIPDLSATYLTPSAAASAYQPLDADLTALSGLTGTNDIYYRSAADTWTAVAIGANLDFSGGTLNTNPASVEFPDTTFTGVVTFPTNVLQTFAPGAANAGLNVGSVASDPSSPTDGSLWYNSGDNTLKARINGSTVELGAGGGSGDVVGPASATDNAIARYDTTTGKLIQNSGVTIDDSGNVVTSTNITADGLFSRTVDIDTVDGVQLDSNNDGALVINSYTGTSEQLIFDLDPETGNTLKIDSTSGLNTWDFNVITSVLVGSGATSNGTGITVRGPGTTTNKLISSENSAGTTTFYVQDNGRTYCEDTSATGYSAFTANYPGSSGSVLTQIGHTGGSYSSYGALTANKGFVYSTASLLIVADNASGIIQFSTGGGALEKMRLSAAGGLSVGTTTDAGAGNILVTGEVKTSKTITAGGTTGNRTINNQCGSVNFAAAATSLVVTNSLVTTSSVIICTVGTNDTTMTSVQAVAASGSFTIYADVAPTAETRVNFLVVN